MRKEIKIKSFLSPKQQQNAQKEILYTLHKIHAPEELNPKQIANLLQILNDLYYTAYIDAFEAHADDAMDVQLTLY